MSTQSGGVTLQESWAAMIECSLANSNNKSILEDNLEKDDKGSFSISDLDCAKFLKKLGLDMSTGGAVDGVQICPGGRGVIFITLKEQEDLNKYCRYDVLDITSTGIRAVMVKPAGKREVVLTLRGVHPSTKDSVVFEYLEKFGSIGNRRVVYGVFSDGPLRGINPISHGGGRILPMAWKFHNSSNSEEFGILARLDFSPFVITKP